MSDRDEGFLPFDLPDWNQGIKGLFTQPRMPGDQAPAPSRDHHLGSARRVLASTQPPHQPTHLPAKRLHDPAAAHAAGLDQLPNANDAEFWLRKAAELEAPEAEAVLMEGLRRDAQPLTSIARALHELHKRVEGSPSEGAQGFAPLSPSRVAGGAARSMTPSRTGLTGQALRVPSRLADTPGAAGAAPPPTKFHGILKQLLFSAAGAGTEERHDGVSIPVSAPAPSSTTTKRLHFCDGTPLATSLPGPTGLKASARRVTFGANNVSPATHRPRRGSGAPEFSFNTPGAIAEGEEEGEEEDDGAANGIVNSRNAGATPFDRRLSDLFAKYGDAEGDKDAAGEEEEKEEEGGQHGTPDLWKRMVLVSAVDSIRKLTAADVQEEQGAVESVEGAGVPEAPQEEKKDPEVMSPNAAIASVLGELLRRSLEDIQAAKTAAATAQPRQLPAGAVSPTAGVLSLARSPSPAPLSTPVPQSLTPMSIDGVPRDMDGIPIITPGTVTMFRGTSQAPERDDGIAADLFRSFDTPEVVLAEGGVGTAAATAITASGGAGDQQNNSNLVQGNVNGRVSPEFEFRPVPAVPAVPAGTADAGIESASEGDTPDLQLRTACSAKSGRMSPDSEAALAAPVAAPPAPTPANTPLRGGGLRLTPPASPVIDSLGKAQRVLSPAPPAAADAADAAAPLAQLNPPPSITKELPGLLEVMNLATPAPEAMMVVTPGDADADTTPARRSTRVAASTARKTTVSDEGPKENAEKAVPADGIDAAGPSVPKTATPARAKRTPRATKTSAPSPAPRYGLRSASKIPRPPAAEETPGPGEDDQLRTPPLFPPQ